MAAEGSFQAITSQPCPQPSKSLLFTQMNLKPFHTAAASVCLLPSQPHLLTLTQLQAQALTIPCTYKRVPTSGPLPSPFPLPQMFFPQIASQLLPSLRILLLSEVNVILLGAFPGHLSN